MDYTKNYHLPQWKKEDRIMMEDFNQMCADIDTALDTTAKSTATAQKTADAAWSSDHMPYAVGTFSGGQPVNVGFRPSFVIICGAKVSSGTTWFTAYTAISGGNAFSSAITFTDTGFIVNAVGNNEYPKLDQVRTYDYIAFR